MHQCCGAGARVSEPACFGATSAPEDIPVAFLHITLVPTVYIVASLYFTLEKISKEVMYHTICVNYEAKI